MEIEVSVKSVYGEEKVYPEDAKARLFCKIAGNKTLTQNTIKCIKELGHEIVVINNPLPFGG